MANKQIRRLRGIGAALLATAMSGAPAAAQERAPDAQQAEEAERAARERIVTPKRTDRAARLARPTPPKEAAPIDWAAVRESVRATRARDAIFEQEVRELQARSVTAARAAPTRLAGIRPLPPERLQRVPAEEVARTRVPLLAPVTADTVSALRVAARENAYTAFAELPGGARLEFFGTRMRVVGGPAETVKRRGAERRRMQARLAGIDAPYIISRHEQGVDLSFSKFGAAYLISISCPDPDGDARCANDDFVLSLVDQIALLNESEGDGK